MTIQELAYWQEQVLVEQELALDASPDPEYDLNDLIDLLFQDECERYWFASRL